MDDFGMPPFSVDSFPKNNNNHNRNNDYDEADDTKIMVNPKSDLVYYENVNFPAIDEQDIEEMATHYAASYRYNRSTTTTAIDVVRSDDDANNGKNGVKESLYEKFRRVQSKSRGAAGCKNDLNEEDSGWFKNFLSTAKAKSFFPFRSQSKLSDEEAAGGHPNAIFAVEDSTLCNPIYRPTCRPITEQERNKFDYGGSCRAMISAVVMWILARLRRQ